jgi:hypothetical protein
MMAFTVPNNAVMAVFLGVNGAATGVAFRNTNTPNSLPAWDDVPVQSLNYDPLSDRMQDTDQFHYMRTSTTATPLSEEVLIDITRLTGACYYIVQEGKAYRICK